MAGLFFLNKLLKKSRIVALVTYLMGTGKNFNDKMFIKIGYKECVNC